MPVEWVGHPLLDVMPPPRPQDAFAAGSGSRPARRSSRCCRAAAATNCARSCRTSSRPPSCIRAGVPAAQFVVARAPHLADDLLAPLRAIRPAPADRRRGRADDVLRGADVALVASGTVTVQAALHECPMVVVYRLSPLTYRLGRPFVHVDTFAMANLVAGTPVVPELIQDDFTPDARRRRGARRPDRSGARRARCARDCARCARGSARPARAAARPRRCSRWRAAGRARTALR